MTITSDTGYTHLPLALGMESTWSGAQPMNLEASHKWGQKFSASSFSVFRVRNYSISSPMKKTRANILIGDCYHSQPKSAGGGRCSFTHMPSETKLII